MKVENRNLGVLFMLVNTPLPAVFNGKNVYQFAKLAKAVKEKLELLNDAETKLAVSIDPTYYQTGGFKTYELHEKFKKEIKPVRDEEIELPDIPQFKLSEWKALQLTPIQVNELIEMGLLTEE